MNHRADGPLILFDGVCNLCNNAVAWIIKRDRNAIFTFASRQSAAGAQMLATLAVTPPDSIVLIDAAGVHTHSDAVLRIARTLGFPWSLAAIAFILPSGLRNLVYSWIARNRYRWFGKQETCMMPTPELQARFAQEPCEPTENSSRPAAAIATEQPASSPTGSASK